MTEADMKYNIDTSKRLYISDMDGTILAQDAELSQTGRQLFVELLEAGVQLTVASARNVASIQKILKGIDMPLPIIEINGAYISDFHSGHHHYINPIDPEIIPGLCDMIAHHNCAPFMSVFDGRTDSICYEKVLNDGMHWFLADKTEGHAKNARTLSSISEIYHHNITCAMVIGAYDVMTDLHDSIQAAYGERMENHFFENFYSPDWWWLTMHDKDTRKEVAIVKYAEMFGMPLENITVFGDNINDVGMMKLNELGIETIAVENAIDEVKALASKVIGANTDDSVLKLIANRELQN